MTFQWVLLAAVTSLLTLAAVIDRHGLRSISPTLSPLERRAALRAHRARSAHRQDAGAGGYLGAAYVGGSVDGGSWCDGGGAGGCSDGGGGCGDVGGGSC